MVNHWDLWQQEGLLDQEKKLMKKPIFKLKVQEH